MFDFHGDEPEIKAEREREFFERQSYLADPDQFERPEQPRIDLIRVINARTEIMAATTGLRLGRPVSYEEFAGIVIEYEKEFTAVIAFYLENVKR